MNCTNRPAIPRIHCYWLIAVFFVIGLGVASTHGQTRSMIPSSVFDRWRWESYWSQGFLGRFKGADSEAKVEFDSSDGLLAVCIATQNDCALYRLNGTKLGPSVGRGPCIPDGDSGLCVSKFFESYAPAKEKPSAASRKVWVAVTSFEWLKEKYSPCSHTSSGDVEVLRKWLIDKLFESERHAETFVIPCFSESDPEVYVLFESIRVVDNRVMVIASNGDPIWKIVAVFPEGSPSYRFLRDRIMRAKALTEHR